MASKKRKDDKEDEVAEPKKIRIGVQAFNQFAKIHSEEENKPLDDEYKRTLSEKWKLLNRTEKAQYSILNSGDSNDSPKVSKDTSKSSNFMATRCSPKKFIDVVSKFSKDQIAAVNEMGFGTLLKLSCSRLRHDLCKFLIEKFDADNHSIEFHGTVLSICSSDFHHILSVPEGGRDLDFSSCNDNCFTDVFVGESGTISIPFVIERLEEAETADDNFRVGFVLMVLGILLCPTTKTTIDQKYLLPLRDPKNIKNLNWASYAFDFLVINVRSFKEKESRYMCGCVLFLQLYYYNSIAYGRVILNCSRPPVTVWGDSESSKLLKHVHKKGGYGSTEVNLVPKVDTMKRHEHEVGDISSLRHDIESWKNVACHIQNSVSELKSVVIEFREESKKAVDDLKDSISGTLITTALGEFQEGILKAVNELKVSVQQLNEKVVQNGINNISAHEDFYNFQYDGMYQSTSAKEDHQNVQANDHIFQSSNVKEDVATPSCKILSDDNVEAPQQKVKKRARQEPTSSSEISPMNLRRTLERKPGQQISSPFMNLDDLETVGKKLDFLNAKLTEVK